MTGVIHAIAASEPRDRGGSIASSRSDFQKNLILVEIIEALADEKSFCVLIEHHEDFIWFDDEFAPTRVRFVQVKSASSTAWTLAKLKKRPTDGSSKEKKLSILGKLFESFLRGPAGMSEMCVVSNCNFNLKTSNGDTKAQKKIWLKELSSEAKAELLEAIKLELEHEPGLLDDVLWFGVKDITIDSNETFSLGVLVNFLDKKRPELVGVAKALHYTFLTEIRRRSGYEWKDKDPTSVIKNKAISSSDVWSLLDGVAKKANKVPQEWSQILPLLIADGLGTMMVHRVEQGYHEYEVMLMDVTNTIVVELSVVIRNSIVSTPQSESLLEFSRAVVNTCRGSIGAKISAIKDEFILGAVLYEFQRQSWSASTTNQKHEEKNA